MGYSEFIKDFLDDADTHLKVFDRSLLSLEKHGLTKEVLLSALDSLQTLKDNSGMVGVESYKTCIHHADEVLE